MTACSPRAGASHSNRTAHCGQHVATGGRGPLRAAADEASVASLRACSSSSQVAHHQQQQQQLQQQGDVKMMELIGRGGFGNVYKGLWRGRLVAVKVRWSSGCSSVISLPSALARHRASCVCPTPPSRLQYRTLHCEAAAAWKRRAATSARSLALRAASAAAGARARRRVPGMRRQRRAGQPHGHQGRGRRERRTGKVPGATLYACASLGASLAPRSRPPAARSLAALLRGAARRFACAQ